MAMETDVLVLGGGVAGLSCAVALKDAGLRVTLVERDVRLGGRAMSWSDPATGDPVHIGPHVLTNAYTNFLELLRRLGTEHRVVWQAPNLLYTLYDHQRPTELRAPPLPAPLHFLGAMLRDPALSLRDLASDWGALRLALSLSEAEVLELDERSASEVLRALGVRHDMTQRTWQLASIALMNVRLAECSAGTLLRTFQQVVSRNNPRLGFPGCGLGDLFAPAARAALERAGHDVLLGTHADALLGSGDRVDGVRLSDGRTIYARHVVSTLPPNALSPLVPIAWRVAWPALAGLDWFTPVPYASVYLWLDRRVTQRQFWARPQSADRLNCDFYDYANIYPGWTRRNSFIASNVVGADAIGCLSDDELVARTHDELADNLVLGERARVVHAQVNRIPLAVVAPRPGFERHRLPARTPIRGFVLAGDWTKTELPSSMESAAASGFAAAEQVLSAEHRPQALRRALPSAGLLAQALSALPTTLPRRR